MWNVSVADVFATRVCPPFVPTISPQKVHKHMKKMYNQIVMDCEVCGCKVKKRKWAKHVKTEKHKRC